MNQPFEKTDVLSQSKVDDSRILFQKVPADSVARSVGLVSCPLDRIVSQIVSSLRNVEQQFVATTIAYHQGEPTVHAWRSNLESPGSQIGFLITNLREYTRAIQSKFNNRENAPCAWPVRPE